MPDYYAQLMKLSLIKGAQATTAIEGNTLTEDEIERISSGEKLAPSRAYQETEVKNILEAFNEILHETIIEKKSQLITPKLLLRFHKMVGKNLGKNFEAVPGKFRENDVVVGNYRCPDHRDVPELIEKYCEWLKEQFRFENGPQHFSDIVIQAMAAHVYLEWIHPFGDGNGRVGRLVEYYILSRGGNPDVALHIFSNHYNQTRPEYYSHLSHATKTKNLSAFIEYALVGFRDGLKQTLEKIQMSQLQMTWQKYVYDIFDNVEITQKEMLKRRRRLALELPLDKKFSKQGIPELSIKLAHLYSGISTKTLERDLAELLKLKIIVFEKNKYHCNIAVLNQIAKRKGLL